MHTLKLGQTNVMENKNKKPKMLLTFIESGMGHITSLQAVKESIEKKYGDKFNIIDIYPMRDDGPAQKYENFTIKQVLNTNHVPGLGMFVFFVLEVLGRQCFLRLFHRTIMKKATDSVVNTFIKENPEVIISTNHYTTYCALEYKYKHNPDVFVATYNPDNNTHVWWDSRPSIFIVNNDLAYNEALRRRFKKENLRQVDFTVRQKLVDANLTKSEYRQKHNLPADKFTVLVADGAYASANAKKFTLELIKTDKPVTILFIAGNNNDMFEQMSKVKKQLEQQGKSNITFEVYPFMPDIHELYCASDIFITKGGPNSIFDCVYMGTPVVVSYYSQPMEKTSYKLWVKQFECGVGCFNSRKIRPLIESYIDNPSLLDGYRNNIQRFMKKPSGSDAAADIIYEEYLKSNEKNIKNG